MSSPGPVAVRHAAGCECHVCDRPELTAATSPGDLELEQPGRVDPTETTTVQRDLGRFLRQLVGRLDAVIRERIEDEDAFGLGDSDGVWADLSPAEQGRRFDDWLDDRIDDLVLDRIADDDRVARDLQAAAERGLKDARASIRRAARRPVPEGGLSRDEHEDLERGLPDPEERLEDRDVQREIAFHREELRQRVESTLDEFAGEARQIAMGGLAAGIGASTIARDIVARGQVAKSNVTAAASAEVVNTFNTTKVEHYWDEVEADLEIEAEVEWVDAGDDRVCELCLSLSAQDWTLEEAAAFDIPGDTHQWCRCSFQVTQVSV